MYIWQNENWPHMKWQNDQLLLLLADANTLRGKLMGRLSMFGIAAQEMSMLNSITKEIVHSAEIEGEILNRDSVRLSVARQLGLEYDGLPKTDHYIEGVVQIMLDATQHYKEVINTERLFSWHRALFPYGQSGLYKIRVGEWRTGDEPMQVVSGAMGKQKIHYEAPPSCDVDRMMVQLLDYINDEHKNIDPLIKAAVVHLWFVTIHPFDDGNGRLCRTLTEMLLSRADNTSMRFYSLSSEILNHRKDYYDILEHIQKGGLDITEWIKWFINTLSNAVQNAIDKTEHIMLKTKFWDSHTDIQLNKRQKKIINLLLDGFEGKLNSSKWYKINHCSQDTANRDIKDLIEKQILRKTESGGRSTSYELCEF
mgnify:CR=1 FL=1